MTNEHAGDAALLIDWENLKFSLQQRSIRPNVSALRDAAERFGRVVVARAYADWQDGYHTRDPAHLYAAGIEPVFVPTRSYVEEDGHEKRKNSVDVKLTADCIELCHNYASIASYVLVTGDQDFLHVVNTLRPYGKRVVIIGVSWTTSARLAERVDGVIYYDREVDPVAEPEPVPDPQPIAASFATPLTWAAADFSRTTSFPDDRQGELESVMTSIMDVVKEYRGRDQQLLLSSMGLELQKRLPPQIFAMVVKGRLKQMIESLHRHGLVKVVTRGLVDWVYMPDETLPPDQDDDAEALAASDESFVRMSLDERREVIEAIRRERLQPGITYLTFNRVRDAVRATAPGRRVGDLKRFVEDMIHDGVLNNGAEQVGFDPITGNSYRFSTFVVNEGHEKVRDCR